MNAQLASLRPLQPWIGTLAVMDGRAELAVTGRGTLADPILEGTMRGDALRFDLPQYGVHLKDGVLRARLAERTIVLDEFSFVGGSGRFVAKGTLAQGASQRALAAAKVEWQATDFTLVNRPDLRLVADGKGTLALEERKVALAGNIDIEEGRVQLRAVPGRHAVRRRRHRRTAAQDRTSPPCATFRCASISMSRSVATSDLPAKASTRGSRAACT